MGDEKCTKSSLQVKGSYGASDSKSGETQPWAAPETEILSHYGVLGSKFSAIDRFQAVSVKTTLRFFIDNQLVIYINKFNMTQTTDNQLIMFFLVI